MGACVAAALFMLGPGPGLSQEAGPAAGANGAEPSAASAQYDVPPKLIRSWVTSYLRPKHGPKKPPDDNVVLDILIDTRGRVTQARIVKSIPFYDDQAISAVKAWLFSPAMKNGQPVAVRQLASVHFGKIIDREEVLLWDEQVAAPPTPAKAADASVSVPTPVAPETAPTAPGDAVPPPTAPPQVTPTVMSAASGDVPGMELLSLDTMGTDFAAWLGLFATEMGRSWHGPKAGTIASPCQGHFEIVLERDGTVSSARIAMRSGNAGFDRAGLKAFFDGSYPALPKTYPAPRATLLVRLSAGEAKSPPAKAP